MPKPPKRPRDPMQLAKMVGELATGERTEEPKPKPPRPAKGSKTRTRPKKKG